MAEEVYVSPVPTKCILLLISTFGVCALLLCFSNDGTEFGGSIYQKVNGNLETAVHLAWTAGSNNTRFGIGAKYQLDKDASLSVRTDLKIQWTNLK